LGIFLGSAIFFILPELSIIILIKAIDGTMKQSIHKSAIELLSLPLPFDLKNKTKSFIDVVVDSIATGIAGFILIFVVKGLELSSIYISAIIIILVGVWIYFVYKVRIEYFKTFRTNLTVITDKVEKGKKPLPSRLSVIKGMKTVFENGSESQILFMLKKLQEINDKRFANDVQKLLSHPSDKVKTAAIQNMYFLNSTSIVTEVPHLLNSKDDALVLATLEYLLLHESKNNSLLFNQYLNDANPKIANAALLCLAREAKDNPDLRNAHELDKRITEKIDWVTAHPKAIVTLEMLLETIGYSNIEAHHTFIFKHFQNKDQGVVLAAITAAGLTMHPKFILPLLPFLTNKAYRKTTVEALVNYDSQLLPTLTTIVKERQEPIAICRNIPMAMAAFNSQNAVHALFQLLNDKDLSIRLEVVRALNDIKRKSPHLKYNKIKVVKTIFEECHLYHQTLSAMHTQIIQQYRNRKKTKIIVTDEEREARAGLLDLLERRLDFGLERIFKLLGLKYHIQDVDIAYSGIMSGKQEAQANAIEFLDNLLSGDLKRALIPIIENTVIDVTSEEVIQKIQQKILTEIECFQLLLEANDLKLKLAVLYLIKVAKDSKYTPLVKKYVNDQDEKLKSYAIETLKVLESHRA
jgi:AAA family ATP:ADP antiporter